MSPGIGLGKWLGKSGGGGAAAPVLVSAVIENAAPADVVLTFDKTVTDVVAADFTLVGKTITGCVIAGSVVTLTVSVAYVYGDVVTVNYVKNAGNVASFTGQAVTNNILNALPQISSILAHWAMDGDATDSQNNYDLTNNNAVLTTDRNAAVDRAYDLSTNAFFTRSPFTELGNIVNEITIMAWFKADALTNFDCIISNTNVAALTPGWGIIWVSSGTKLRFFINSWNTNLAELTFNDTSAWHCVIASFNKNSANQNIKISIDGGTEVTANYTTAINNAGTALLLGKGFGPVYFNGKLDGVVIWNKELTQAEKLQAYAYY